MPSLRDALDRFRRAGTPGAAARAGVPVDRTRDARAELTPVLAGLDATQAECRDLRDQARREADQIRSGARQQAAQTVADARNRASVVRAQAASAGHGRGDAEVRRLSADAMAQAERIHRFGQEQMPAYTARIVDLFQEIVRQEEEAAAAAGADPPVHLRRRPVHPPQQRNVATGESP